MSIPQQVDQWSAYDDGEMAIRLAMWFDGWTNGFRSTLERWPEMHTQLQYLTNTEEGPTFVMHAILKPFKEGVENLVLGVGVQRHGPDRFRVTADWSWEESGETVRRSIPTFTDKGGIWALFRSVIRRVSDPLVIAAMLQEGPEGEPAHR
jgi:hypothetical protein